MEWFVTWAISKVGVSGVAAVAVAWVLAQVLQKAQRKQWVVAFKNLAHVFTNVPRRFRSEWARIQSTASKNGGYEIYGVDKIEAKSLGRVIGGIVEDGFTVLIDVIYIIIPVISGVRKRLAGVK